MTFARRSIAPHFSSEMLHPQLNIRTALGCVSHIPYRTHAFSRSGVNDCPMLAYHARLSLAGLPVSAGLPVKPSHVDISNQYAGFSARAASFMKIKFMNSVWVLYTEKSVT